MVLALILPAAGQAQERVPVVALGQAVAGPDHLFALQWAERFPAGAAGRAAGVWAERLRVLATTGF
jgi:sugar phosphate permease